MKHTPSQHLLVLRAGLGTLTLSLTGCGTREALTSAVGDTAPFHLVLLLPAAQVDLNRPLPDPLLDLLKAVPAPGSEWQWSPHPELKLLRHDGSVAAVFKAGPPETRGDLILGRNLPADERFVRFRQQIAGKPLRELLGIEETKPPGDAAEVPTLAGMTALLAGQNGEPALHVHCAGLAGSTDEKRKDACPAVPLATSEGELKGLLAKALPPQRSETTPAVRVLAWMETVSTPATLAGSEPAPAPAPVPVEAPAVLEAAKVNGPSAERATGESSSPLLKEEPVLPGASTMTVNNNYETVVVLPEEPPAGMTGPEERQTWTRLVKGATPLTDAEFYYAFNTTDMDRENSAALEHHIKRIHKNYSGYRVIVGGYSDEVGDVTQCTRKAMERARKVADRLKAAGIEAIAAGYGTSPPDRGGPVTGPDARERRRCVILYLVKDKGGSEASVR